MVPVTKILCSGLQFRLKQPDKLYSFTEEMIFFVLFEASTAAEIHVVFTSGVLRCIGHWPAVGPRSNKETSFGSICAKFRATYTDKKLSLLCCSACPDLFQICSRISFFVFKVVLAFTESKGSFGTSRLWYESDKVTCCRKVLFVS